MATETERSKWSVERLDDLNQNVREGFARTDRAVDDLRSELRTGFTAADGRISDLRMEMRSGFARTDHRFDQLQRALILGLLGLAGTLIASIAATVIALA
jgi:hypothetical protein